MLVPGMSPTRRRVRAVRHRLLQRRRLIAAMLVAAATLAGVRAIAPPPLDTVDVLVARRDLPAGARLEPGDLTRAAYPASLAPAAPTTDSVGRVLAAPIGRGEPVTGVRLVGPALAEAQEGQTVLPVRLPDAGMASLLRAGDVVDLYATDPGTGEARLVAVGVTVLATPRDVPEGPAGGSAGGSGGGSGGALVVLGVSPAVALTLTGASLTQFLTVALGR